MPLNDPTITATCDECGGESEPMELCSLAGGGWDERNIPLYLKRQNWAVVGERTLCEECNSEQE